MPISISAKIRLLKKARNHLLRQQKKGVDVDVELGVVCERISNYRMLDKNNRKNKVKP